MSPKCRRCGVELTDENWYTSQKKHNNCICMHCQLKPVIKLYENIPEKMPAYIVEYLNRSDVLRTALRNLIRECGV